MKQKNTSQTLEDKLTPKEINRLKKLKEDMLKKGKVIKK